MSQAMTAVKSKVQHKSTKIQLKLLGKLLLISRLIMTLEITTRQEAQPRLSNSGEVVLLGKAWNLDVESWTNQSITVLRRDSTKGDKDDYDALKRFVNKLLDNHQLAKNVSIQNSRALASLDKPTRIYCMWSTVDKGYKARHLLRYWEQLRNLRYYTQSGNVCQVPINFLTFLTDSAGFSLSAAKRPTKQEVKYGKQ